MVKAGSSSAEQGGLAVIIRSIQEWNWRLPVPTARSSTCHMPLGSPGSRRILIWLSPLFGSPSREMILPTRSALRCTSTVVPGMTGPTATRRYQPHLQPLAAVPHLKFVISQSPGWMDQPRMRLSPGSSCLLAWLCSQELPAVDRLLAPSTKSKPCSASVEPSCGPP